MKHLKDVREWEDYINQVVCGDCLVGMRAIPDNYVDLVVTDPPLYLR